MSDRGPIDCQKFLTPNGDIAGIGVSTRLSPLTSVSGPHIRLRPNLPLHGSPLLPRGK
jgi:hypothetical protein